MGKVETSGASIAKQLASCNQYSRRRAVRLFCSWLPNQPGDPSAAGVSDAEFIKIWKGLFFCVWHSDKLPIQVELINCLSTLLSSLPSPLAVRYLDFFLLTIRREWSGIDFLRLDKFYLLIRRFLRHCFIFLKKNSWNLDLTANIVGVLSKGSLLSVDKFQAAGVNYHITEIFLDEILESLPLAKETLDLMLKPFFTVLQTTDDKVLVSKIKVGIFDRLAENGANLLNDKDEGGEVENFGRIGLGMGFSKSFFDLASAVETQQGNRKVLFGLHSRYLKLEKELEKSGLDVSLERLDSGSSMQESEHIVEAELFSSGSDGGEKNQKSIDRLVQKTKKGKKVSDGTESKINKKKDRKKMISSIESNDIGPKKKSKIKKKKKLEDRPPEGNSSQETIGEAGTIVRNENGEGDSSNCISSLSFDDNLISSLQEQFEKVAAEAGMAIDSMAKYPKKRKRPKNTDNKQALVSSENVGGSEDGKSVESIAKKVRFSMMNNLIWKPQNPMPPQSLRLPPSVTPRGSALKKGLSPGPIRKSPPTVKNIKVKDSSVKKGRKSLKTGSPAVYLRFLEAFSVIASSSKSRFLSHIRRRPPQS